MSYSYSSAASSGTVYVPPNNIGSHDLDQYVRVNGTTAKSYANSIGKAYSTRIFYGSTEKTHYTPSYTKNSTGELPFFHGWNIADGMTVTATFNVGQNGFADHYNNLLSFGTIGESQHQYTHGSNVRFEMLQYHNGWKFYIFIKTDAEHVFIYDSQAFAASNINFPSWLLTDGVSPAQTLTWKVELPPIYSSTTVASYRQGVKMTFTSNKHGTWTGSDYSTATWEGASNMHDMIQETLNGWKGNSAPTFGSTKYTQMARYVIGKGSSGSLFPTHAGSVRGWDMQSSWTLKGLTFKVHNKTYDMSTIGNFYSNRNYRVDYYVNYVKVKSLTLTTAEPKSTNNNPSRIYYKWSGMNWSWITWSSSITLNIPYTSSWIQWYILPADGDASTSYKSSSQYKTVNLNYGQNSKQYFSITSESGSTKSYSFNVYRQLDSNTNASSFRYYTNKDSTLVNVSPGSTISLASNVSSIYWRYIPQSSRASSPNYQYLSTIGYGNHTVSATITAESGHTRMYSTTVYRPPCLNTNLNFIRVQGITAINNNVSQKDLSTTSTNNTSVTINPGSDNSIGFYVQPPSDTFNFTAFVKPPGGSYTTNITNVPCNLSTGQNGTYTVKIRNENQSAEELYTVAVTVDEIAPSFNIDSACYITKGNNLPNIILQDYTSQTGNGNPVYGSSPSTNVVMSQSRYVYIQDNAGNKLQKSQTVHVVNNYTDGHPGNVFRNSVNVSSAPNSGAYVQTQTVNMNTSTPTSASDPILLNFASMYIDPSPAVPISEVVDVKVDGNPINVSAIHTFTVGLHALTYRTQRKASNPNTKIYDAAGSHNPVNSTIYFNVLDAGVHTPIINVNNVLKTYGFTDTYSDSEYGLDVTNADHSKTEIDADADIKDNNAPSFVKRGKAEMKHKQKHSKMQIVHRAHKTLSGTHNSVMFWHSYSQVNVEVLDKVVADKEKRKMNHARAMRNKFMGMNDALEKRLQRLLDQALGFDAADNLKDEAIFTESFAKDMRDSVVAVHDIQPGQNLRVDSSAFTKKRYMKRKPKMRIGKAATTGTIPTYTIDYQVRDESFICELDPGEKVKLLMIFPGKTPDVTLDCEGISNGDNILSVNRDGVITEHPEGERIDVQSGMFSYPIYAGSVETEGTIGGGADITGDPYVKPLFGEKYKLPVDNCSYRLFEKDGIIVNGQQWIPNEKEIEFMNMYMNTVWRPTDQPREYIYGGMSYFKDIYVSYNGKSDVINLLTHESRGGVFELRDCSVGKSVALEQYEGERCKVKEIQLGDVSVYIKLYSNLQILTGVHVFGDVLDGVGALVHNTKSKYLKVSKLEDESASSESKKEKMRGEKSVVRGGCVELFMNEVDGMVSNKLEMF